MTKSEKGQATRQRIIDKAFELFRERGFDQTTMRDIAAAAELATGAAYHYFKSKEGIVLAYFDQTSQQDESRMDQVTTTASGVRERLALFLHGKVQALAPDRKAIRALFRRIADPDASVSIFGSETSANRRRAMSLFARALAPEKLASETEEVAALALWALEMALLLYFIGDDSKAQQRTHQLIDGALDIVVPLIALAAQPGIMTAVAARLRTLLVEAGLMP